MPYSHFKMKTFGLLPLRMMLSVEHFINFITFYQVKEVPVCS